MKHEEFELPGCPVMIANGLYEIDQKWPDVAMRMLQDHLTDQTRTCCDEHGFALVDPETGCTAEEIFGAEATAEDVADADRVSELLYQFCKRQVMKAVNDWIAETRPRRSA